MAGKNEKNWHVWLSSAWFHCHTGIEKNGDKTGHRNNTATKKWSDKPFWGTCAYRAVADSEKGPAPPPLVLDESRGPHGWGKLIPPPPPSPPYLKVWIRYCKEHQRMGVFQFWSCSKEIIFYLVLKNSSNTRGVGTSSQQSFHYLWSTPIKRKNVSEMASAKNLNRRQNSPD